MYHCFLIHSSADGHLGWFHVLAIANSAVMNTVNGNKHYKQLLYTVLCGKRVSFNSGFLGMYAQQWDCWVIRQFYFQFFKESPHCSP